MKKSAKKPLLTAVMVIMVILTLVYSLVMPIMAGAGLLYNGDSYGSRLVKVGICLIISGIIMTAGNLLSLGRKRNFCIISVIMTAVGLILCLAMVYILCSHADSAGWADSHTAEPVSRMYRERLLPAVIPCIFAITTNIVNLKKSGNE